MSVGPEQDSRPQGAAINADPRHMSTKGGVTGMVEFLVLFAVVALWFALQAWILPAVGVPT